MSLEPRRASDSSLIAHSSSLSVRLARHAMATRFELLLYGDDATYLRAAGEEALEKIERLEEQLSFYRTSSEICDLNARAARQPVPVDPRLLRLLQTAKALTEA